jgi:hypothetical protein
MASNHKQTKMVSALQGGTERRKKPTRRWRIVKWGTLVGFIVVVFTFAILLALVFHKVAPPEMRMDPVAGVRMESVLKQAEATATTDSPQAVRVDEGSMNSMLESRIALTRNYLREDASAPVRDVKVKFVDDQMHAYVVLGVYGKDMSIELEGRVRTEGGYLQFDPLSARIGALSLPKSMLRSAMTQMMSAPENREHFRLPANLSDLRVEDGHLVITFK